MSDNTYRVWLDDYRRMPDDYDVHMYSASDAIDFLKHFRVSHISFDHDLGRLSTGYDVAKYIEAMAWAGKLKPLTYDIHSANPVGAKNIEYAMAQAIKAWETKK